MTETMPPAPGDAPEAGPGVPPGAVLSRHDSPHVEHVEIDGETVIYDTVTGALHLLDPVATVIWNLLDGSASLGETSGDLAAATGRQPSEMQAVVLELAGRLEEIALVHRVPRDPT